MLTQGSGRWANSQKRIMIQNIQVNMIGYKSHLMDCMKRLLNLLLNVIINHHVTDFSQQLGEGC